MTPCSPRSTPSTRSTRSPTIAALIAGPMPMSPRPPASTPVAPISASPTDRSSSSRTRSAVGRSPIRRRGDSDPRHRNSAGQQPPRPPAGNGYPIGLSRDASGGYALHARYVHRRLPGPRDPQRQRGHQLRPVLSGEPSAGAVRSKRCNPESQGHALALFFCGSFPGSVRLKQNRPASRYASSPSDRQLPIRSSSSRRHSIDLVQLSFCDRIRPPSLSE